MKTNKRKTLILILCMLLFAFALTACGDGSDEAPIVGTWVAEEYPDFVYTFHADGTGDYSISGIPLPFTYEDTGSQVSILFEGNTDATTYNYTIEDDKFLFEDSFGEIVVYVKK